MAEPLGLTDEELEELTEEGELVYDLFWDSGGPGAGADSECIYKYKGDYYFVMSTWEVFGPYDSLTDVLAAEGWNTVTEAVQEITCTEMGPDELVRLLDYTGEEKIRLVINGETWMVDPSGEFRRVPVE